MATGENWNLLLGKWMYRRSGSTVTPTKFSYKQQNTTAQLVESPNNHSIALTRWIMYLSVSGVIISSGYGSGNGFVPIQHQVITYNQCWLNVNWPLGKTSIKIQNISFKENAFGYKKWWSFCWGTCTVSTIKETAPPTHATQPINLILSDLVKQNNKFQSITHQYLSTIGNLD